MRSDVPPGCPPIRGRPIVLALPSRYLVVLLERETWVGAAGRDCVLGHVRHAAVFFRRVRLERVGVAVAPRTKAEELEKADHDGHAVGVVEEKKVMEDLEVRLGANARTWSQARRLPRANAPL